MKIYHNPRCRKSRQTLTLIQEKGKEVEIIEYLKSPPTFEDLKLILKKLSISPIDLIRDKEEVWKEKYKGKKLKDDEMIQAIVNHPKIMERPIVINGMKAIIGSPPENVLEIID